VDVVDWSATSRPIVARGAVQPRYASPTLIGVIGTLLIHALVVPSAFIGGRGSKPRLPESQAPANLQKSKGDSTESLVLITLPTTANSNQALAREISSPLNVKKIALIPVAQLEPPPLLDMNILPLGDEQAAQSPGDGVDGARQARLFGLYTGQIRARIERIWRRPRSPINGSVSDGSLVAADESFQCQAQIVQDENGYVQEVLLPQCNGSPAWQRSLVTAIQQASPLPAPPSARVFNRSIALTFVAVPYAKGSSEEDYDIEVPQTARSEGAATPAPLGDGREFRPNTGAKDAGNASSNFRSSN
jgi:TonB C terminal